MKTIKSRDEIVAELDAAKNSLSMLGLIRLLYCARALLEKDKKMGLVKKDRP
jgi:hypothetical protein